jgi:hypothetical protein
VQLGGTGASRDDRPVGAPQAADAIRRHVRARRSVDAQRRHGLRRARLEVAASSRPAHLLSALSASAALACHRPAEATPRIAFGACARYQPSRVADQIRRSTSTNNEATLSRRPVTVAQRRGTRRTTANRSSATPASCQ